MTDFSAKKSARKGPKDPGDLAEAIYGGPAISATRAAALLRRWRLKLPLAVLAVEVPQKLPGLAAAPHKVLQLHPGIAYVLVAGAAQRRSGIIQHKGTVVSEPQVLRAAHDLVWAIQQAVLSLRRKQLGPRGAAMTQQAEVQARSLALHLLRSRHPQSQHAVGGWLAIVLSRHQARLKTVRRKLLELLCLLALDKDDRPELAFPFDAAVRRLLDTYSLRAMGEAFRAALSEVMSVLATRGEGDSLVAQARRMLENRYAENIGLAQVAREVRCSPTHLSRVFRQQTGRTLTAHLQALRMARAKELLLETDAPLRTIGPASGFQSHEHFHRIFRRETRMTPGIFRTT